MATKTTQPQDKTKYKHNKQEHNNNKAEIKKYQPIVYKRKAVDHGSELKMQGIKAELSRSVIGSKQSPKFKRTVSTGEPSVRHF